MLTCAFGLEVILFFRQLRTAPKDSQSTEPDREVLKKGSEVSAQPITCQRNPKVPEEASSVKPVDEEGDGHDASPRRRGRRVSHDMSRPSWSPERLPVDEPQSFFRAMRPEIYQFKPRTTELIYTILLLSLPTILKLTVALYPYLYYRHSLPKYKYATYRQARLSYLLNTLPYDILAIISSICHHHPPRSFSNTRYFGSTLWPPSIRFRLLACAYTLAWIALEVWKKIEWEFWYWRVFVFIGLVNGAGVWVRAMGR